MTLPPSASARPSRSAPSDTLLLFLDLIPSPRRRRTLRLLPLVCLLLALSSPALAQGTSVDFGGHVKYQLVVATYPGDSLFRGLTGSQSLDHNVDLRLNLDVDRGAWDLDVDYQLVGLFGDTIQFTRDLPPFLQLVARLPQDQTRLFSLTRVFRDEGRAAILQRLDRVSLGYSGEKTVVRFGRQAISWGNGIVYTPMDIFNPFDPAAVDKEYKTGDDMLYGQYLRGNGDDLQGVAVFRRNLEIGKVDADWSSFALKYHGLSGGSEFDVLVARHFADPLLAVGGSQSLGGAVWRGDVVATFTDEDTVFSAVTSLSYSWVWGGKNVSGVVEYFFNGFGQPDGQYYPDSLAGNPELLRRVVRGELFTLGRHYVVGSALIELHPLFQLTPTVFTNLSDGSALIQLATKNDLKQDLVLLGAFNLPVGPDGTEFGGIETDVPGQHLSRGPGLFLQLAWYF